MRIRELGKNLNAFTSNCAVICLPDFLRDERRELNETLNIDRGLSELMNFCLSL